MKLFFAALLAAVVSFGWGFFSWMVLDWHRQGMKDFKDEASVSDVVKASATHGTGIYVLPFPSQAVSYAGNQAQEELDKQHQEARENGPYVYAIVRPGKLEASMTASLGWSFGRSFLCALVLGGLLMATVIPYIGRVAFCAGAGLLAGASTLLPQRIWFELPLREVAVGLADSVIEWTLAGIVLALFLGRNPTARDLD